MSGANWIVVNDIAITSGQSRKTRMKRCGNRFDPAHCDGIWQVGVGAVNPASIITDRCGIEVNNLSTTMNTRISTTGTDHSNRVVSDFADSCLDRCLNGRQTTFEGLPAMKSRPVILNAGGITHGGYRYSRRLCHSHSTIKKGRYDIPALSW